MSSLRALGASACGYWRLRNWLKCSPSCECLKDAIVPWLIHELCHLDLMVLLGICMVGACNSSPHNLLPLERWSCLKRMWAVCFGACSPGIWVPQPSEGEVCTTCSGFHRLLFQMQFLKLLLLYTHTSIPMDELRQLGPCGFATC